MGSSNFDLNEIPLNSPNISPPRLEIQPESPIDQWPGIDDNVVDEMASFYQGSNEEHVVQPSNDAHPSSIELPKRRKARKELKAVARHEVLQILLSKSIDGFVPRQVSFDVSVNYDVSHRTILRFWKDAKATNFREYKVKRENRCGRPRSSFELEALKEIPVIQRKSVRHTAFLVHIPKSTLFDRFQEGEVKRHSNAAKPFLSPARQIARMQHCLASVDPSSSLQSPRFLPMHNTIHIDEKWFYIEKKGDTCYILPGEKEPYRNIRSSRLKIMFLAAVARPRYDNDGKCTFDGKIGIFPLVEPRAAARSSHNRPRGTIEIKQILSITRKVIREFMVTKVLPAILEKWPRDSLTESIYIQQDNAPTHLLIEDPLFQIAVLDTGLNISLVCQPANIPDLNVLDLGFFRAIQSLQEHVCCANIPELIAAVEDAFIAFDHIQCNNVFLTLQSCMVEILKVAGGNNYAIPHMAKARLRRHGELPLVISCPADVYANAVARLSL